MPQDGAAAPRRRHDQHPLWIPVIPNPALPVSRNRHRPSTPASAVARPSPSSASVGGCWARGAGRYGRGQPCAELALAVQRGGDPWVLAGIIALVWPGVTLYVVSILVAWYLILFGILIRCS
jgi:hypothetical protein